MLGESGGGGLAGTGDGGGGFMGCGYLSSLPCDVVTVVGVGIGENSWCACGLFRWARCGHT